MGSTQPKYHSIQSFHPAPFLASAGVPSRFESEWGRIPAPAGEYGDALPASRSSRNSRGEMGKKNKGFHYIVVFVNNRCLCCLFMVSSIQPGVQSFPLRILVYDTKIRHLLQPAALKSCISRIACGFGETSPNFQHFYACSKSA